MRKKLHQKIVSIMLGVGLITQPLYAEVTQGLIGHWKFDDATGQIAADSAGTNRGNLINGPTWAPGIRDGALLFDGVNDYVNTSSPLPSTPQISFSIWAKKTGAGDQDPRGIIVAQNYTYLDLCLNGHPLFSLTTTSQQAISGGSCAAMNEWMHYVGTYNGNVARLYLNGREVASKNVTGPVAAGVVNIGRSDGGNFYFKGLIDDVRFFNRELSPSEVQQLFTGGGADTTPPTISITSPASGSTVSTSRVYLVASVSDDVGVAGVQFKVDGADLGQEVTTAPYLMKWDSTTATNGPHPLSAVVRDLSGNVETATANVTVDNVTPPPPPPLTLSGINSSNVQGTSAMILWTTNRNADSQIEYGLNTSYGSETSLDSDPVTAHTQMLTGLQGNMEYHFRVKSRDSFGNYLTSADQTFTTLGTNSSEHIYIAQNQSGNNSGTSCANAHNPAWFNIWDSITATSPNWTATQSATDGKIGPGDTVHLCGTISTGLTAVGSGTSGNPITILFEPNAKMSAPTFPNGTGIINVHGQSWITVDGGTNGIIEATGNGTAGYREPNTGTVLQYQNGIYGVFGLNVSHVTVQNLTVRDLYVRQPYSRDANRVGANIQLEGSDILIKNNILREAAILIGVLWSGTQRNITIDNNRLNGCNHCLSGAALTSGSHLTNFTISNNFINGEDSWETGASPLGDIGLHRNGIIIFDETGSQGSINNFNIYNNHIHAGKNPLTESAGTMAIFFAGYYVTNWVNVHIFNNLFTLTPPLSWSNHFMGVCGIDGLIANNTLIGRNDDQAGEGGGGMGICGTNTRAVNNLFYKTGTKMGFSDIRGIDTPSSWGTLLTDHNIYFSSWRGGFAQTTLRNKDQRAADGSSLEIFDTASFESFEAWQAYAPNRDPHSTLAQPILDSNFRPQSFDSTARGKGLNLSAICATVPELCKDRDGNPRPTTGAWTIGAFETCSGNCGPAQAANGTCSTLLNTCVIGSFVDVNDTSTDFLWSCVGLAGGATAQCSRSTTAPAPVNGVCSPDLNMCLDGTFSEFPDTAANYLWKCLGINNGTTASCFLAKIALDPLPQQLAFRKFVNKFNPLVDSRLAIHFDLNRDGPIKLSILSVRGELVKVVFAGNLDAGFDLQKQWDGTNQKNEIASTGIYVVKLEAHETSITTKLAVVK